MSMPRHGVDLHTHTSYSDGLDAPAVLAAKAARQGLQTIAVTDHDTVEALGEAQEAGRRLGLEVLAGVELSACYQAHDDLHILGYLFDPAHADLQARLMRFQDHRVQRGLEILTRINTVLKQRGLAPLESAHVLQRVHGALTRPHLARELIARGYASTVEHAFQTFLIACNVPKVYLSPEEAFDLVARAGGLCSLAHPGTISSDPQVLQHLLSTFKAMGLVGVEAYHPGHAPAIIDFVRDCARRQGLIVTGGSDYHGHDAHTVLGQIAPGVAVPDSTLLEVRKAHRTRTG